MKKSNASTKLSFDIFHRWLFLKISDKYNALIVKPKRYFNNVLRKIFFRYGIHLLLGSFLNTYYK